MNKIIAVIVIYNKSINDINSIENINVVAGIDVLIVDNSTIDNNNEELANHKNMKYIKSCGNIGLSKAYNQSIEKIKKLKEYKYILLCDDDTIFTVQYLEEVRSLTKKNIDVIIPQIINNYDQKVCSPKLKSNIPLITKVYDGIDRGKGIKAINSGLCIKLDCFDVFKYNESNFLYFVDVNFFEEGLNKHGFGYEITTSKIEQNFSQYEKSLSDSNINQMKLRLRDSKKYNNFFSHNIYKIAFISHMLLIYKKISVLKLLNFKK